MKEITVAELKARLDRKEPLVLIDVRQPEEHAQSRIPGAKLMPLGELPQRVGELDPQDEIIVHCKSGGRSARACEFLTSRGFKDVTNVRGGNDRWQAEFGG